MAKFNLLHITLYAKGWYKREHGGNTIWDDLKVMFGLDDYQGEFMTKNDMVNVMLNHCQLLDVRAFTNLTMFASGINKDNSYKNGYLYQGMRFQKEDTTHPEWDYQEAIVRYCLSELRFLGKDELPCKLPKPNYNMGIKRNKGISNKSLTDHFDGEVKIS